MACFYHPDREAAVTCSDCGKLLCRECGSLFQPPTCRACAEAYAQGIRSEMIRSIAISVVLMLVGIFAIGNVYGIFLAGIPYGWALLNRVQPSMFLWLSWVGWLVYFFIKLLIAYLVGVVALPIKIVKWITELRRMNGLLESARS